jgi:hypothetical protein
MKITITNATGSQKDEAELDPTSGVIVFESGEISHVLFEKNFNKTIFKWAAKADPVDSSAERSEPSKKPVSKPKLVNKK